MYRLIAGNVQRYLFSLPLYLDMVVSFFVLCVFCLSRDYVSLDVSSARFYTCLFVLLNLLLYDFVRLVFFNDFCA